MHRIFSVTRLALLAVGVLPASACAKPMLNLQDCIAAPDGKTILVADIRKEAIFGLAKDVEDRPVRFLAADKELGVAVGGEDGISILECTLPDKKIETIQATASIDGVELRAEARVFRWDPRRVVVVLDIDDTICRTDMDDVLFDEEDDSKAFRNARETLTALTADYELLYLTARPSFLLEKTKKWLAMREFPPAPIIVSHRKSDLLRQGVFKERVLDRLKRIWPNILIGVGDRATDAHAYGEASMLSIIICKKVDDDFGRHSLLMPDWVTIKAFFANNRKVLTDPRACKDAVDGKQPLLLVVNPFKNGDD